MKRSEREDWRILYEIICCAEWKETGGTLGIPGIGKRTVYPTKTQLGPDWLYALSPDLHFLAILQDASLEIRSSKDNFASTLVKNSQAPGVVKDAYPWLRQLTWSYDSSLLAVAFTNGVLTFFDITGAHLFTLRTLGDEVGGPPPFSPAHALTSLFFLTERIVAAPSLNCARELVCVNTRGILKCYRQPNGEGSALTPHHEYSFRPYYPQGVLQVQHVPTHSILIIAGNLYLGTSTSGGAGSGDNVKSQRFGLTCWRILHDHPYYRIHSIIDPHEGGMRPGLGLWGLAIAWTKQGRANCYPKDTICKLRLSSDGMRIAGIHESGSVSVWHVPSLHPQCFWPLNTQLQWDTENPHFNQRWRVAFNANSAQPLDPFRFHPFDLNWWGNDKLILSRVNGCVTLVPAKVGEEFPDRNFLGDSPELFESPMAVFPRGEAKGFFALECEIRHGKEDEAELLKAANSGKWRVTTLITNSLFWLMDIEKFRPAPKKRAQLSTGTRTFRFFSFQSITPLELFNRKLEAEEYGDALDLVKLYDLDPDLVYQRQWTRSPVSLHSIRDYLAKIKKRNWVLQECLERVPDSIDATRELLEFGLKGTDLTPAVMISQGRDKGRFILWSRDDLDISESEYITLIDPENEEVRRLIRYRHQFLHFLDMLQTYEYMLGGPLLAEENFDPIVYKRLRSRSPWESGISMARDCDISGLRTLLTYHWPNMESHYLQIISSFPETVCPHDYRDFLPSIEDDGSVVLWSDIAHKEPDWSQEYLPKESAETETGEEVQTIVNRAIVEAWYEKRIRQIEDSTGLVNYALDLGRLGLQRSVESLRKLTEDLEILEVLVYQVGLYELTLDMLEPLGHFDRLELLMSKATEETFVSHLRHLVFPFLDKWEARIPESRLTLLNQYLSSLAVHDLHLVLQVFQASKLEENYPLIPNIKDLMKLAYNAIYACENPKESDNILGILGCIPDRGYGHDPDSTIEELHDSIDELELHYKIGQILGKYDIWLTLHEIEKLADQDDTATEEFLLNICHSAVRMIPPLKLNEWKALLYDLLDLKKKVLAKFPTEKCFELYVGAVLKSGVESVINLAKDFVGEKGSESASGSERYSSAFSIYLSNIPQDRLTNLILDAASSYFDSASSFSDTDMSHAKTALALLPQSVVRNNADIQILLDLIDAVKLLNKDFALKILPQAVRKTRNRLNLIETAMQNIRRGYRKSQQLLRLSVLLRVGETRGRDDDEGYEKIMGAEETESVIMEKCGQAGMEEGDLPWVVQLCHSLMAKGYGVGWGLFYNLAKLDGESDSESSGLLDISTRMAFINYALTFCPPDEIITLLKAKYRIEIRSLQNRSKELSPSESSVEEAALEEQTEDDGVSLPVDDILHKTRIKGFLKTTTSWINPLKDLASAGKGFVPWPRQSDQSDRQSSLSPFREEKVEPGNEDFEKEGYPPFRLGAFNEDLHSSKQFHKSQLCYNYDTFSSSNSPLLSGNPAPALELCLILHRIWHLERLITGWKEVEPQDPDVVSCLVCDILPEDLSWGLALLLSIDDREESLRILSTLPSTPLLHYVRLYYLALLIKKQIGGLLSIRQQDLCYQNPKQLIAEVKEICSQKKLRSTGDSSRDKDLQFLAKQFKKFSAVENK